MQGFLPILPLFLPLCSFFLTLKLLIYQAFRFIQQPLPTLWTPSYFVSTAGNICTETVKKYIEQQRD
jgi:REP element-mobilizing transposase RayT